ncbi:uncharacterized protein E0L32_005159 [Thyridium curvatum]|uniref:DUF7702 domain-containing protein n=1 Tax=Thyridium curvatum TaxID=1093900 RepID=A0A507B833_9PEZI|nr:uncharacterized protein E0L32_005159 [Thyridium curvatum]TPX14764.1 hypothetical protein E0L32_005159 [Thyridium curvatum]
MSGLTYRNGLAILQIVFFSVYLVCGILLCIRHGFSRKSGWLILITFSLLRLIGASFELAAIHYASRSVYGGALICEAIGISPLTVLNLGLLIRVNRWLTTKITAKHFGLLSIASLVGISLSIYGGTKAAGSATPLAPNAFMRAGACVFTAIYLAACAIFAHLWRHRAGVPAGSETRLLYAFAACAPLIAVRLAYALVAQFAGDARFSSFGGDPTVYLCMSVLEEIAAVAICVGTGLTLARLPAEMLAEGGRAGSSRDEEEGKGGGQVRVQQARY